MKTYSFASHGRKLQARLYIPDTPNGGAALIAHGYGSNQAGYESRAQALANAGLYCLTFDMSGHGESEGDLPSLSIRDHLQDIRTAYDFLASQPGVDVARIALLGASYGAFLSVLLTQERPCSRLLLRAPAIYPDELYDMPRKVFQKEAIRAFREQIKASSNSLALNAIRNFAAPVEIIASEFDEQIPKSVVTAYAQAAPQARVQVLKGAAHTLHDEPSQQAFLQLIIAWAHTV